MKKWVRNEGVRDVASIKALPTFKNAIFVQLLVLQ